MTDQRMRILDRYGRLVWGGAALMLLLVLIGSLVLSGSSVAGAEQDAQARAESLSASVVEEELTPDLLARDIRGTAYRDLTVRVQAGILSDDRFTAVRIWRLDGALVYSMAQMEDAGVIAGDDQWIAQALEGQTVSARSSEGTIQEGVERPNEDLFQTFVPIRLSSESLVDGVVEIDQRYSAVHDQAFRVWRPVQYVALVLLVAVGVLFVRWVRNASARERSGAPIERRLGPGRRADDLDAVARADRAERLARESEQRLRELEATVAAAPSTATLEELDLKLRASEAEREELAGTVRRLQASLSDRGAELALAREGSGATRGDTKRVNKLIADADSRAVAAEKKAAAAEKKTQEAAKRATVTAGRSLDLEAQLREAERRAVATDELAASVGKRRSAAEKKIGEVVQRALRAEQKAADAERLVAQAERRATDAEELAAKIEKRSAEAEQRAAPAERKRPRPARSPKRPARGAGVSRSAGSPAS
jgi:hypothetical protein